MLYYCVISYVVMFLAISITYKQINDSPEADMQKGLAAIFWVLSPLSFPILTAFGVATGTGLLMLFFAKKLNEQIGNIQIRFVKEEDDERN